MNSKLAPLVAASALLLAGSPRAEEPAKQDAAVTEDWAARFQSTLVYQAHPGFRSPYEGPNSLNPGTEIRETITTTAFLATRLWPGAELYVDPEAAQGFGFSDTLGLAGFPNGEATKAGARTPHAYLARYFLRQVIGFGGETETVAADQHQLAGRYDVSRLTLGFGKMAANDLFDDNTFSHDPRREFLNWSLWESAAWDFPADARGYTYGAVADLNQKDWALRWGWFLMPKEANTKPLEARFLHSFGAAVELETRHRLAGRDGKLRWLAFLNKANMGKYERALAAPGPDGTPDITAVRASRVKHGFAINLEQALTEELGLFSRLSWNDGRTESFAFTEIDRSAALGVALKGGAWGRGDDTLGLAGVVNGLAEPHRDYLAAGGIGFIVGDGRLAYATERILEAYYDARLLNPLFLGLDYQLVDNPAYNRDRGPVHILAARVHAEF